MSLRLNARTLSRLAASLLVVALSWPAGAQTMRAHFLDVGQGSATIIESECAAILVDSGGEMNNEFDSTQALLDLIDDFFLARPHLNRTFDLFVLSHPHIDHTRGVRAVVERYKVRNAVTNGQEASSGKAGQKTLHRLVAVSEQPGNSVIGFEPIRVDDLPPTGLVNEIVSPITCGSVQPRLTALWGTSGTAGWTAKDAQNQNNHSVVLRVDFGAASILLTGDLEERGIAGLLSRYKGTGLLDADVYLVGHHGAANATTEALLNEVTPKIAVISMGVPGRQTSWTAWAYGHPRKVIVQHLSRKVSEARLPRKVPVATGVKAFQRITLRKAVYATGWDGTVVLEVDTAGRWRLAGEQPEEPEAATPRHPVAQPPGPGKVNINAATADELDALPMIGLGRARRIVEFREANGPFSSVDDLRSVPGIGAGTLKAVRHLIEVR